ncbi:MAG: Phage terminase, large subunit, family [candidate division NC10 bacterium]|nr:Phage terminase, large subunit, family [candidate division NC10 bacterium]
MKGSPVVTTRFQLSPAQTTFWRATERYVDFEGAVRAGKTTPALLKVVNSCQEHPGIQWLICRWTQDATDAQLKARFRELCPSQALGGWNAQEQYFEIRTRAAPSRIYVRGLKASEDSARYSKFAGLTLAGVYVDQPEELPHDFYLALKARLSQPDSPHQMLLTPNPPNEDHWLAKEFPVDNSRPEHVYIRTTVYDNRAALGEEYIADLEAAYPPGTVLRRRFIEGLRGLSVVGEPVYGGYFQRPLHVVEDLACHPEAPLYEGWDFGHGHPCVVWAQFLPIGALHVLGGVMGAAMFIEDFCPIALQYRAQWFPKVLEVRSTGDPAGQSFSPHGVATSAFDVLAKHGVKLQSVPSANRVDRRDVAIQSIAGYMRRLTSTGPAFHVASRFVVVTARSSQSTPVLVDGFEAGYVWDSRSTASTSNPNTRRPLKDGYYDHGQNCLEYILLAYGPTVENKKPVALHELVSVNPGYGEHGWMA